MSKHTQPKPAPAQPEQLAPADGDELHTVTDEAGNVLGTVTPEQAAVIADAAADLQPEQPAVGTVASPVWRCIARESFHDVETHRDYTPGDVVLWNRERAERYAARGTVAIVEE